MRQFYMFFLYLRLLYLRGSSDTWERVRRESPGCGRSKGSEKLGMLNRSCEGERLLLALRTGERSLGESRCNSRNKTWSS